MEMILVRTIQTGFARAAIGNLSHLLTSVPV